MKGCKTGVDMNNVEMLNNETDGSQDEPKKVNKKDKKQQRKKHLDSTSSMDNENDVVVKNVKKSDVKNGKLKNNKSKKNVNDLSDDDNDDDEQIVSKASNKKTKKKNAFEGLMMDDDDDDEAPPPPQQLSDDDDDHEEEKVVTKKNEKKGKKNKRKEKNADDEDLDKILAELQAEYAGEAPAEVKVVSPEDLADEMGNQKKKKGKKQKSEEVNDVDGEVDGDGESTVKTAAQKKREKKERQKREAALAKQRGPTVAAAAASAVVEEKVEESSSAVSVAVEEQSSETVLEEPKVEAEDGKMDKKNKKKSKKDKKEEEAAAAEAANKKKKGMSAAMVAAIQEQLKKAKEEEERLRREEEERIRLHEEREAQRLEALRLEAERKEKKKQKEAERKARLKAEGKLLTKKQKEDRARAQAMLEALKAQGLEIPDPNEKRPTRPGTRIRPKKKTPANVENKENINGGVDDNQQMKNDENASNDVEKVVKAPEPKIKESWDASDSEKDNDNEGDAEENNVENGNGSSHTATTNSDDDGQSRTDDEADDDEDEDSDDEDDEDDDSSEDETVEEQKQQQHHSTKNIVRPSKQSRTDELRAAVVCVLGHVDTGKTKILDKLRRTHVQDSEAGGITQQIGATNVPIEAIIEQSKHVREAPEFEFKLPGLLIIDTPGHESFSNLRNRGSSLCDIAILVVDIMHGLESQTIESIQLLKKKKCPFIVALNKIDRLYDWQVIARRDVRDVIKDQESNTQAEFNARLKEVQLQFAEQGFNTALFHENPDPKTYVSLVPTSAVTGEGMGNLLFLLVEFSQRMLHKRLQYSEELQATVLEVKAIPGLGTTIDAILINGRLREGETMVLAGTDGPIVTQIRSLLMPQPLKELRVKSAFVDHKVVKAAQGVKIAAKDLEKAIAGINLLIAHNPDEIERCKEMVANELKSALSHIKLAPIGVYVQASTLGSLEALLEFLRTSKIPYSAIRIGPVVKRDVMKASIMLEHEAQYATILAFDVKVEREAQEMADALGVKIFQADIIYHLFDKFTAYREELKQKKREEFKSIAVFPCKLKILPQFVFNSRDPIIAGVMVENGIVKIGTPLCVPSKEFVDIGVVTSIESNHKQLEFARKGMEVCIKIEPIPGESPKLYGRHFDADDMLVSKISRQSIDACKDYFRDDLIKADWSLMVELKKLFQIM